MKKNNFDFMRFMAASMVVFSHSFQVTDGSPFNSADPLYILSHGQSTLGYLAVAIFFIMSGYLIFGSAENKKNEIGVYFWHRILRIFPALTITVLISVILIGGILTNNADYWTQFGTYKYLLNIFLAADQSLPGVFTNNPSYWINGPLWTLKFEFVCYILAAVFAKFRFVRTSALVFFFLFLEVLFLISENHGSVNSWIDLPRFFFAGGIFYTLKDFPFNRLTVFLSCCIAICIFVVYGEFSFFLPIVFSYVVLTIARGDVFGNWGRYGDLSYGIYLIGWPVQQIIYVLGFHFPYENFLLSYPLVIVFAYISWQIVEKPALGLKNYRLRVKENNV